MNPTRCPKCNLEIGIELTRRGLCPACTPERLRREAPELAARFADEEDVYVPLYRDDDEF